VTDGGFSDDGTFHPLATWDGEALMRPFRERLLALLVLRHAISEELARMLLAWRRPGFSAHVGEPIAQDNASAIEDLAGYVVAYLLFQPGLFAVVPGAVSHIRLRS
jgi:hypothetical protein